MQLRVFLQDLRAFVDVIGQRLEDVVFVLQGQNAVGQDQLDVLHHLADQSDLFHGVRRGELNSIRTGQIDFRGISTGQKRLSGFGGGLGLESKVKWRDEWQ